MSEMKFTPGPWFMRVGLPGSGPWDRVTVESGPAHSPYVVCTVNRHSDHPFNAHLIAAAPELYAALEAAFDELLLRPLAKGDGHEKDLALRGKIRTALAKARGAPAASARMEDAPSNSESAKRG